MAQFKSMETVFFVRVLNKYLKEPIEIGEHYEYDETTELGDRIWQIDKICERDNERTSIINSVKRWLLEVK